MSDQLKIDVYWRMVPDYVWAHDDLTATDVVVWCALLTWADSTNEAFPSQASIARRAGISSATVRRSLDRLRDALAVTSKPHPERETLVYTMHMLPPDRRGGSSPVSEGGSSRMSEGGSSPVSDELRAIGTKSKPLSSGDDVEDSEEPYTMSHVEAFDVLARACGLDADGIRNVGGGLIGKNAKIIRDLRVTEAEVLARANAYRRKHPEWDLTPAALVKWWPTLQVAAAGVETCECGQPLNSHSDMAHEALMEDVA